MRFCLISKMDIHWLEMSTLCKVMKCGLANPPKSQKYKYNIIQQPVKQSSL